MKNSIKLEVETNELLQTFAGDNKASNGFVLKLESESKNLNQENWLNVTTVRKMGC